MISLAILSGVTVAALVAGLSPIGPQVGPSRRKGLLLAVPALIAGAALVVFQCRSLERELRVRAWTPVQAKIVASKVAGQRALHPDITYTYEFNGHAYTGESLMEAPGFGNKASRRDVAETTVEKNPVGKVLTVLVNPMNPSESQVRATLSHTVLLLLSVGALGYGLGTVAAVRALRPRRFRTSGGPLLF